MSETPFKSLRYKGMQWVEDTDVPAESGGYILTNKLWTKYAPQGLFGLPYKLESGDYRYYAGQSRDDYPTLRAPVIEGDRLNVDTIEKFRALLEDAPKEQKTTMDQKDLIIELMAAEIERGRTRRHEALVELRDVRARMEAVTAKLRASESAATDLRRDNLRLDEKRLEALNKADAAEAKCSRLEAALAKCRKSGKKGAK